MPLVERFEDWTPLPTGANRGSDDPRNLNFDHRLEADANSAELNALKAKPEYANALIDKNISATCVITNLDPDFGWVKTGANWTYKPASAPMINNLARQYEFEMVDQDFVQTQKASAELQLNVAGDAHKDLSSTAAGQQALTLYQKLVWPQWPTKSKTAPFQTKFDLTKQYFPAGGFGSGYYLGGGYVGTAGHCIAKELLGNKLSNVRIVFGWVGDPSRNTFSPKEIFEVESVEFCEAPGQYADEFSKWAKRWDTAIIKLKGSAADFSHLNSKAVEIASEPPRFGTRIYNVGAPLGTPLKLSPGAHVLRHSLYDNVKNPFLHAIQTYGSFSTELDQFGGNSGGPVFDAKTGKLYGHTISTQSEVAGSLQEMTEWENEYLSKSSNYADCKTINKELATRVPTDEFYRLHPKWLRMFLAPNPMISNVTHICPGDFGPNKQPGSTTAVPESTESVVFNRLRFNTEDVYWKNLSGRVDRLAIFLTDIDKLCTRFEGCKLQIRIWGPRYFARPPPKSTLSLLLNGTKWPITLDSLTEDTNSTALRKSYTQTVDLKTLAKRQAIPAKTPSSAPGLLAWTEVELQSPFIKCEPSGIGFDLVVQRASFNFPVNATWPPGRADITANPSDANLKWPAEDFHFATTVGDPGSKLRKGVGLSSYALNQNKARGYWTWTADMDKVWTNPRQPPQGMGDNPADTLLNEIMEDRDPNLG